MRQLIHYGVIGLTTNTVAFGVYVLITAWSAPPTVAMTLVYVVAASLGFVGNRSLTFAHRGSVWGAGARYLLAHCIGYLINLGILVVAVDHWHLSHVWVQAVAIFVVAAFLFTTFKFFVFTHENEAIPA